MSYDGITNLNELSPATPLDGASQAEMALAIRQLKAVVKNVLLASLHPNGLLRSISADVLSTSSVGTDQLADASVTTAKIANAAVNSDKIGALAVLTAALAELCVTSAKIADEALLTRHFSDACVPLSAFAQALTAAQISSSAVDDLLRAISADHLANNSVTDRAVADVAVTKLTGGDPGQMLVKTVTGWIAATLGGGLTFNTTTNQFEVAPSVKQAHFGDYKSRGADGGSSATTWTTRDLGEVSDLDILMVFTGNTFKLAAGTYAFFAKCPFYGAVGKTQARLHQTAPDGTESIPLWGTSEDGVANASGSSMIQGTLVVTDATTVFKLEHWCQNVVASNGFGLNASSDNTVVYANHNEVYTTGYVLKLS